MKDLRIFANRDLSDMIMVDNSALSFAFQIDNGFPIMNFIDDPLDQEFDTLMKYMQVLSKEEDLQAYNRQAFNLSSIVESNISSYI